MVYLWIALVVIPSPVIIIISSEAIAILWSLKGYNPILIALSLALGQTVGFSLITLFGERLGAKWAWVRKRLDGVDLERYRRFAPRLVAWSAFVGIPPVNVTCLAAGAVKTRLWTLIPLLIIGRFARYWIVASVPELFSDYINVEHLPAWLRAL